MSDLSYEAWDLGSRFMRGTGRWLELNTAKLRGFEVPLPGNILPAGLSGVGDDMAALLKQVASEDPDISAEAIRSINVMRTDAYSAASHFGGEMLDKGQVFTGQDAKILYAYAAAGDWESYQALRYVEKQDPNVLKDFGVDLTPLKVKWKKPTAVTVGAAAGVGIAATSVWALSQVLESSPPDGITLEAQQTIDQILRDNPDDKDALLKDEQAVEDTDLDVLISLLARERARVPEQVHEAHGNATVDVQDEL
ncbi:hypothetical protein FRB99_003461 [Tulasnella sp. 403]|nr:hypothetical protein FRB99_003461 [Tulasnella sp. 403]